MTTYAVRLNNGHMPAPLWAVAVTDRTRLSERTRVFYAWTLDGDEPRIMKWPASQLYKARSLANDIGAAHPRFRRSIEIVRSTDNITWKRHTGVQP